MPPRRRHVRSSVHIVRPPRDQEPLVPHRSRTARSSRCDRDPNGDVNRGDVTEPEPHDLRRAGRARAPTGGSPSPSTRRCSRTRRRTPTSSSVASARPSKATCDESGKTSRVPRPSPLFALAQSGPPFGAGPCHTGGRWHTCETSGGTIHVSDPFVPPSTSSSHHTKRGDACPSAPPQQEPLLGQRRSTPSGSLATSCQRKVVGSSEAGPRSISIQ